MTLKNQVFNYLTKIQKSGLSSYISSFVKKNSDKTTEDLIDKFVENENYYLAIDSARFPCLSEFIEDSEFLGDLELWIKDVQKKLEQKEKQKPFYEKQKQYMKEQRKRIQEFKMSKAPPSKAQLSYYKSLCKKYKLENSLDIETASKLDFKNAISKILEENKKTEEINLSTKLSSLSEENAKKF